jgi:hypothetical protein
MSHSMPIPIPDTLFICPERKLKSAEQVALPQHAPACWPNLKSSSLTMALSQQMQAGSIGWDAFKTCFIRSMACQAFSMT